MLSILYEPVSSLSCLCNPLTCPAHDLRASHVQSLIDSKAELSLVQRRLRQSARRLQGLIWFNLRTVSSRLPVFDHIPRSPQLQLIDAHLLHFCDYPILPFEALQKRRDGAQFQWRLRIAMALHQ
jgi:hypothetical protein